MAEVSAKRCGTFPEGLQVISAFKMSVITACLPADEISRHSTSLHQNSAFQVKTLISYNNYWRRETDDQICLKLCDVAMQLLTFSQGWVQHSKVCIWIKVEATGQARARSYPWHDHNERLRIKNSYWKPQYKVESLRLLGSNLTGKRRILS